MDAYLLIYALGEQGHRKLDQFVEFAKMPKQDLRGLFVAASPEAIDFLSKLLTYDPRKRLTSKAVRAQTFFASQRYSVLNFDDRLVSISSLLPLESSSYSSF